MTRSVEFTAGLVMSSVLVVMVCMVGTVQADFVFGEPTNLGLTVNSSIDEFDPAISADSLELYFHSTRSGTLGNCDLWVAERPTRDDTWDKAIHLAAPLNSSVFDGTPSISADGLALYFCSGSRPGGAGDHDIWMATRAAKGAAWGPPVNLGPPVNTAASESHPFISADGLSLYFATVVEPAGIYPDRPGGYGGGDIWVSTRATTDDEWGEPQNLGATVNSPSYDAAPCLSADGLMLFFHSDRLDGIGYHDIWVTTRRTTDAPWEEPRNLRPPVNTSYADGGPALAADGRTLYFFSGRPGGASWDLYRAPIIPIVDLNGDSKVDGREVLAMVEHWGQDAPLCDIGPMPWGDGVVDVEDLRVLAEYIGTEVVDGTLIAHWALDETEGDIAYDSAGDNHGVVMGVATWQAENGVVGGALEFNGVDACVETPFVLNPADGSFSVLVWVQSGAPGQVIISQIGGKDWLLADTDGALITNLRKDSRSPDTLSSQAIFTDGGWHHVGLTWDGTTRSLYVDDVLVAEDAPGSMPDVSEGLNIGCGSDQFPDSFFSGLIDDVRIYNRAVRP